MLVFQYAFRFCHAQLCCNSQGYQYHSRHKCLDDIATPITPNFYITLLTHKTLLQRLEATVKDLLLRETDADVLFALQTSIQDLDGTDTGSVYFLISFTGWTIIDWYILGQ